MKTRLSLLFLLLGVTLFATLASARQAPEFTLPDSDGNQVSLSSFRGKYVMIEFLLTTCPHCQSAGKVLEQLQQEYKSQFQVLGVSTGPQGVVAITDYKREHAISYPILQGNMKVLMDYMGVTPARPNFHVPVFFLIGPDGQVLQERNADRAEDKDFYANADKNLETLVRQTLPAPKPAKGAKKGVKKPAAARTAPSKQAASR